MSFKICLVTGATSGIGEAIAHGLAQQGAGLILVGRSEEKGARLIARFKQIYSLPLLEYIVLDLSSQQQIRTVGKQLQKKFERIDVLINNAGIWTSSFETTEDGIERQFAVNHLAPFLLTHLLLPQLESSGNGRVLTIGSNAYKFGEINFEDYNLSNSYHGLKAYGQSKLANLLFTREFDRINPVESMRAFCVSPGLVKTDIGVKHTSFFHSLMWKIRRLGGKSPEEAAKTVIHLALNKDIGNGGKYWENMNEKNIAPRGKDDKAAEKLWMLSEKLCGIENYFGQVR